MRDFDNRQDILDTRDLIERIDNMEEERQDLLDEIENAQEELDDLEEGEDTKEASDALDKANEALREWDYQESEELARLKAFAAPLEGYGDYEHGETLIRESYFTEYCEDMLKDCGDLPQEIPHYIVIDWDATADNLKIDYTESDFDGVTYYMRA